MSLVNATQYTYLVIIEKWIHFNDMPLRFVSKTDHAIVSERNLNIWLIATENIELMAYLLRVAADSTSLPDYGVTIPPSSHRKAPLLSRSQTLSATSGEAEPCGGKMEVTLVHHRNMSPFL